MRNKPGRWYARLSDGRIAIYDHPYPQHAASVSLVSVDDLAYYRNNFDLQRIWT